MKTLDEVIEYFNGQCKMRHVYLTEDADERFYDALHYLKQLQKIEDEYEELKDWWAEEHAENVPLSWDELKTMEGKPVWLELLKTSDWKGWDVVSGFTTDDVFGEIMVTVRDDYFKSEFGKTWKAYRRER